MRSCVLSNNKYDIFGDAIPNKFISPLGNEVTLIFPSHLHLDNNKSYEVSIRRASIVYCTPNISASLGSQVIKSIVVSPIPVPCGIPGETRQRLRTAEWRIFRGTENTKKAKKMRSHTFPCPA